MSTHLNQLLIYMQDPAWWLSVAFWAIFFRWASDRYQAWCFRKDLVKLEKLYPHKKSENPCPHKIPLTFKAEVPCSLDHGHGTPCQPHDHHVVFPLREGKPDGLRRTPSDSP